MVPTYDVMANVFPHRLPSCRAAELPPTSMPCSTGTATGASPRPSSLMLEIHIVSLEQPVEHVLQHLGVHTWREREA